jgi:hypothetical protein
MEEMENVRVFGLHDENTLAQMKNCAKDNAVVAGVLCADGHLGYAVPIGGVLAYDYKISPSGVGFDIACLAGGTLVTTRDGYRLPIETVDADAPILCWDGAVSRRVVPNLGAIAKGTQATIQFLLENRRSLTCTPDHEILTKNGWLPADQLRRGDKIACLPFTGVDWQEPADFADLPAAHVWVFLPYAPDRAVPRVHRPLLLTGTLEIGNREEKGENAISFVRLILDKPVSETAKKTTSLPSQKKPAHNEKTNSAGKPK